LLQLLELGLGPPGRTGMESETVSVRQEPLPLEVEILGSDPRYSLNGGRQGRWVRDQFPSTLALDNAARESFLSSRAQQASIEIAEFAFAIVVSTRQSHHIVTMEPAGRIIESGLLDIVEDLAQKRVRLPG